MFRTIKYILCLMLTLPFAAGCSENLYLDEPQASMNQELPVTFEFMLPTTSTRGFDEGTAVKTSFASGDMIHVFGTFKTSELQEDGTYKNGEISRYGALRLNGKTWEEVDGSNMRWPAVAVSGQFKAYYISESDGVLTDATESKVYPLAKITPTSDPLEATSDNDIVYGHAVPLTFKHVCAYLNLIDLEPQVSDSYWFKRDGVADFNNAFKLVLEKDQNGAPTSLDIKFCQESNPEDYNGLVYIAAKAVEGQIIDDNGELKNITKANYFLQPGNYDTFSLCYPAGEDNIYNYLQYDYSKIPDNVGGTSIENTRPDLKAGTIYKLIITKSPGITITSPPSGEGWDESDNYFEVDVETFLKAVYDKAAYEHNGKQILEATANGVKLLCNVDFRNFNYANFNNQNFVPNIMEGTVFDGDYHYIRNLGSPLFRYNYGTIQNVGIRAIKIDATSYENADPNKDMSRHGALCMWNRPNATINNVHIFDVDMTVSVKYDNTDDDGSETHNIGCVVGSNTGKISEVALAEKFSLHIKGENEKVNASVLIGGIAGQNAAEGNIYDVSPLESDLNIEITNECIGEFGSYSVGGIVGESSGTVTGVILSNVRIDGSKSRGVISYMGGIAGQLAVSDNLTATASVESCIVSGSVTAGQTVPYGNITSSSYIGGIAGADLGVPITDCRTAVAVHGSATPNTDVIYATGGAIGRIWDASTFENLIAYGSELVPPSSTGEMLTNYVGNFAGIVPKGQTWEKDYAEKNILIRTFGSYAPIGKALDSNNQE